MMSFLGSIGHIMKGSGLRDVLQLVSGEQTVSQILEGKAYAQAVREHFLVDAALNALLLRETFSLSVTDDKVDTQEPLLKEALKYSTV
jgi:hypothetical protein